MAASITNLNEQENFFRLCRLLIDKGTLILGEVLNECMIQSYGHAILRDILNFQCVKKQLGTIKQLNNQQKDILYINHNSQPVTQWTSNPCVTTRQLDITLLILLLRNIFYPTGQSASTYKKVLKHSNNASWKEPIQPNDFSAEADITRIRVARNKLYGHITTTAVPKADFDVLWPEIADIFVRLSQKFGLSHIQVDFDCLKCLPFDQSLLDGYARLLQLWKDDSSYAEKTLRKCADIETHVLQLPTVQQARWALGYIESLVQKVPLEIIQELQKSTTEIKDHVTTQTDEIKGTVLDSKNVILDSVERLHTEVGAIDRNISSAVLEASKKLEVVFSDNVEELLNSTKRTCEQQVQTDSFQIHECDAACVKRFEVINRELNEYYLNNSGLLTPVPWCEDFQVKLQETFTTLTIVREDECSPSGNLEATKEYVTLTGIFEHVSLKGKPSKRILIEGDPGVGKSTLCRKIACDWASSKMYPNTYEIHKYKMLFLVEVRQISGEIKDAIFDQLFPEGFIVSKEELWSFIQHHERDVIILVDGYDELQGKNESLSNLVQYQKLLRHSSVVMTTRRGQPKEVVKPQNFPLKVCNEGFSVEQALDFVRKFSSATKVHEKVENRMTDLIKTNDLVRDLCKIPINALFFYLTLEENLEAAFSSASSLYWELVHCVLRSYCKKEDILDSVNFDEFCHNILADLGMIAFQGLNQGKLIYNVDQDIRSKYDMKPSICGKSYCEHLLRTGFVVILFNSSRLNPKKQCQFMHRLIQEYLSAYYLANCLINTKSLGDQEAIIDKICDKNDYYHDTILVPKCNSECEMLWSYVLTFVINILVQKQESEIILSFVNYVCNNKASFWNNFYGSDYPPGVEFFRFPIEILDTCISACDNGKIKSAALKMIGESMPANVMYATEISEFGKDCGIFFMRPHYSKSVLFKAITECSHVIKCLRLNSFLAFDVEEFLPVIKKANIREIVIGNISACNRIRGFPADLCPSCNMDPIYAALKANAVIQSVSISLDHIKISDSDDSHSCYITDVQKAFLNGLKDTGLLTILRLHNIRNSDVARRICDTVRSNATITCLDLHFCAAADQFVRLLCEAMMANTCITSLRLKLTALPRDADKAISSMLCQNSHLSCLTIEDTNSSEGCLSTDRFGRWILLTDTLYYGIASGLKSSTSLAELTLIGVMNMQQKYENDLKKIAEEKKVKLNIVETIKFKTREFKQRCCTEHIIMDLYTAPSKIVHNSLRKCRHFRMKNKIPENRQHLSNYDEQNDLIDFYDKSRVESVSGHGLHPTLDNVGDFVNLGDFSYYGDDYYDDESIDDFPVTLSDDSNDDERDSQ